MTGIKQTRNPVSRNAGVILTLLMLVGASVGANVGAALWIISEMDDVKTEVKTGLRVELGSAIREELQASEQRQLAAIEIIIDEAVRKAFAESRLEYTDLLDYGWVVIDVLPDGRMLLTLDR